MVARTEPEGYTRGNDLKQVSFLSFINQNFSGFPFGGQQYQTMTEEWETSGAANQGGVGQNKEGGDGNRNNNEL